MNQETNKEETTREARAEAAEFSPNANLRAFLENRQEEAA